MAAVTSNKKKVTVYKWSGRDNQGKIRRSEISALNEQLVRTYLKKQGITPISVFEKPKDLFESKGRIKSKHIVGFSRQMSTMLKAGMSVTKSLALVADGINKPLRLKEMVEDLKEEVEAGSTFSAALAKYPLQFDDLYVSLVTSGEEAGVLDSTMDKIATNQEKSQTVKRKVKKALTYPVIVVFAAIIVTAILLIKVIPVFEEFFADFGAELPALTQSVIGFSRALRSVWLLVFLVIFVAAICLFFYVKRRNRDLQRNVNKISFRLPILGDIMKLGAMARFARTLSVLFESGVPLVKSLGATAPATGSVIYEEATNDIQKDVENGAQLNFAMQSTDRFDTFAVQMVGIGEESGNLGEMLGNVATYYEEELDYKIDNLTTMLEPLIIGFLALVVGTLVIAMYMPIFKLADVVK